MRRCGVLWLSAARCQAGVRWAWAGLDRRSYVQLGEGGLGRGVATLDSKVEARGEDREVTPCASRRSERAVDGIAAFPPNKSSKRKNKVTTGFTTTRPVQTNKNQSVNYNFAEYNFQKTKTAEGVR